MAKKYNTWMDVEPHDFTNHELDMMDSAAKLISRLTTQRYDEFIYILSKVWITLANHHPRNRS